MKLPAGEIYFVGERDVKTKEISSYVKIGIVREGAADPRTSEERLKEHQTGNPRELFLHEVILTPAVEEIETRLHKAFAQNGVSGEWFQFTPKLLEDAVLHTKHLRDEVQESLFALETSEILKKSIANDIVIQPSSEAKAWHATYVEANEIIKISSKLKEVFEKLIVESAPEIEEIQHILTKQIRSGATFFNVEIFKGEHPDIYFKYTQKQITHFQRFKVSTQKSQNYSLLESNPVAWELLDLFGHMLEIVPETNEDREVLHEHYLRVIGVESDAFWKKQIAEAHLKVLCAENQGIEDICTWPREDKVKESFNQDLFAQENPDLFASYLQKREDVEATIVDSKKGY